MKYLLKNVGNKLRNQFVRPDDRLITHLAVAIILALFFYLSGGSALFTSDSGAYLLNARELKVPGDRSIFYSCFIHYASEYIRLFHEPHVIEIVLIQALIAYSIIFVFFKNFFKNPNQWIVFNCHHTVLLLNPVSLVVIANNARFIYMFGVLFSFAVFEI